MLANAFDRADFAAHYTFTSDGAPVSRRTGRPVKPQSNGDYEFYYLTDNDGCRHRVSALIVHGLAEEVAGVFQLDHFPDGWEFRPGFPSYLFNNESEQVRRVGFLQPRANPCDIKPNKAGKYRLHTPDGYKWYHHDDLFI